MNTIQKGDEFENISIELIHKLISREEILINEKFIRTFKKKKYKCKSRDSYIEFDYVIEVWPPNSERYSVAYFIECKNHKTRVGVNQLKKFHNDIMEVTGTNAKAIFITKSLLQEGANSYAETNGFMVIQANNVNDYKIIYHKSYNKKNTIPCLLGKINDEGILGLMKIIDNIIFSILEEFTDGISYEIDKLNKQDIELICEEELKKINPKILTHAQKLDINLLKSYLNNTYNIIINYQYNSKFLGTFDVENNIISLNHSIKDSKRELFVLCHEFGHYKLHQNLKINQNLYNMFNESEYNFLIGKHSFTNAKHWIEWQANHFASNLILPKSTLLANLFEQQLKLNLKKGPLYLDDQFENYKNYQTLLYKLSEYFNVTRPNIIFQLKEINHFINKSKIKSAQEILREIDINSHI